MLEAPSEGTQIALQRSHHLDGLSPLGQESTQDERGSQLVAVYTGGVIVIRLQGSLRHGSETNRVTEWLADAVKSSPHRVLAFFDLAGFTNYTSEVRVRYTEAMRRHGPKVERIQIFADSRLVRMGATVAGLVLPQLSLVDRATFDRQLADALAERN